ncbi:MAG: Ref family recombination enhancement nuclease [Pseudomonadota bacterium]
MTSLKKHYNAVAALGCYCCYVDYGKWVEPSLHHPFGRKRGREKDVIPLCWHHHQSGNHETPLSIHGNKKEWIAKYGEQEHILEIVNAAAEVGIWPMVKELEGERV